MAPTCRGGELRTREHISARARPGVRAELAVPRPERLSLDRDAGSDRDDVGRDRGAAPSLLVDRPPASLADQYQRRVTSAWFADAESPVTSAWSNVAGGINVRWKVAGKLRPDRGSDVRPGRVRVGRRQWWRCRIAYRS